MTLEENASQRNASPVAGGVRGPGIDRPNIVECQDKPDTVHVR